MVDNLSKSVRSKIMRSIKSSGTRPELLVRKLVFALGYRYRLLKPRLPGRPDLIFPKRKKVIFVHGCFWHAHFWISPECPIAREPDGKYWKTKLLSNKKRDDRVICLLRDAGWESLVIWECELSDAILIRKKLTHFLA
jgi:DNA mismatch endonuclease (patch repair protein)